MKPLSPTARRLLELSLGQDEPDALSCDRVARSLAARIASGVDVGAVGTAIPIPPAMTGVASASLGAVVAKTVMVACVGGALATGGWMALRSSHHPVSSPPHRAATAPIAPASPPGPSPAPAPILAQPSPDLSASRKPARPRPEPKAASSVAPRNPDHLRDETEALRSAQQALRDGQGQQALRLLEEQDAHFRDGLLAQERSAARVLALCQTGSVAQARVQAELFERRWPRSALMARVRFACWKP
jgi:hypothetical protein